MGGGGSFEIYKRARQCGDEREEECRVSNLDKQGRLVEALVPRDGCSKESFGSSAEIQCSGVSALPSVPVLGEVSLSGLYRNGSETAVMVTITGSQLQRQHRRRRFEKPIKRFRLYSVPAFRQSQPSWYTMYKNATPALLLPFCAAAKIAGR